MTCEVKGTFGWLHLLAVVAAALPPQLYTQGFVLRASLNEEKPLSCSFSCGATSLVTVDCAILAT